MELSKMLDGGGGAKIATGSYTGIGTNGSSNPNSITLPFAPEIFVLCRHGAIVLPSNGQWSSDGVVIMPIVQHPSTFALNGGNGKNTFTFSDYMVSWYYYSNNSSETSADKSYWQFNAGGAIYDWMAIG